MSGFLSFSKPPGNIMRKETVQCSQLQENKKKWSLNSRTLLKTEKLRVSLKIQNVIKFERKEELEFAGFVSFIDPCQWSKFEPNWSISIPELR